MTTSAQVLQSGRYLYDVFIGMGYDNWTRVRRNHWGVSVVAGNRLGKGLLNSLSEAVKNNPVGSYNSVILEV